MSPVEVASGPRLSWGVTKASGHGLKLGMLEFMNIKTVGRGPARP
jgi:hypothetical protein